MKLNSLTKAGVSALTLATLTLATLAPAAEAGHRGDRGGRGSDWGQSESHGRGGSSRRYKNDAHESRGGRGRGHGGTRVVEIHRSSSAGPVIAGIIGGVALGAILSNSSRASGSSDVAYERGYDHGYQDGATRAEYDYYDPYCEVSFGSFDACRAHERDCRHPRVIQVIATDSGRCVGAYNYRSGGWRQCDAGPWEN